MKYRQCLLGPLLLVTASSAVAATVYVTDQLQFGLHADKTTSSPVVSLVTAGSPLELVKTEDKLSFVRTTDGVGGWIDNSYITQQAPAGVAVPATGGDAVTQGSGTLAQDLISERIKTGELQVQIAELRKRLGQDGSNDSLYEKIDQLAVEKKQLEVQLAQMLEGEAPPSSNLLADIARQDDFYNPRNMLITLAVALIAGVIAGLYLMDYLNRRRHGGFRI